MKIGLFLGVLLVSATLPAFAATNTASSLPPPPATAKPATLTPDQIKTIFGIGKPFTAVSASGTKIYSFTFNPDGTALEVAKGATKGVTGKWRVDDKGYCTAWGKGTEHCYVVDKGAKGYEVRDAGGNLISTWKAPAA